MICEFHTILALAIKWLKNPFPILSARLKIRRTEKVGKDDDLSLIRGVGEQHWSTDSLEQSLQHLLERERSAWRSG